MSEFKNAENQTSKILSVNTFSLKLVTSCMFYSRKLVERVVFLLNLTFLSFKSKHLDQEWRQKYMKDSS